MTKNMKAMLIAVVTIGLMAGCGAISKVQNAAQAFVEVHCAKPKEQREASRVLFNSGLNGHQVQIVCKNDEE